MFAEQSIKDFAKALAAKTPTPGGGSAAANASLLGTSLLLMAIRFSQETNGLVGELEHLSEKHLALIDEDAKAYDAVQAAYHLPKNSQDERSSREKKIQDALHLAAQAPLTNAKLSLQGLKAAEDFSPRCNKNLVSDLGTAALLLYAGLHGALLNVKINAKFIKDRETRASLEKQSDELLANAKHMKKNIMTSLQKFF